MTQGEGGGRDPSSYFNQCLIDIDFFYSVLYQIHSSEFQSIDKTSKSIDFSTHFDFVMG